MLKMPQEVEVWYILPAIRKELAKNLIKEHKLSQREVAKLLGVTEAAVSQYVKSKRAKKVTFDKETQQAVKKSSDLIVKGSDPRKEMQKIMNLLKQKKVICKIHKSCNLDLNKDCCICY